MTSPPSRANNSPPRRRGGLRQGGEIPIGSQASTQDRLTLAGLSLLGFLLAFNQVLDSDTWWHLAGGRLILAEGIPRLNTFSHTWPDHPWRYTQWLFGVLLRLLELAAGPAAATLAPALCVGAAVALSLDTVRRRVGALPALPLVPLTALVLLASRFRFVPRPHVVTFLGLALLLNLRERGGRRLPLWFALAGMIWSNCHAGVAFGLALAALMPLADLAAGRRAEARRALAAAAAFFAGSLLNPSGFYPYLYSFEHLDVQSVVVLAEFRHASWERDPLFFALAALALLAVPFRVKRRDFLYPLAAAAFLALAVDAVRVAPKFLFVVFPGLAATIVEGWRALGDSRGRRAAAAGAAALLAAVAAFLGVRSHPGSVVFGWGVQERLLPEGAAGFIVGHGLAGRMFNEFDQGGYLAWRLFPGRRIFVDGRVQAYPAAFFRETQEAMHGRPWSAFMERHGIDYAVVQRRTYGSRVNLAQYFEGAGWPLVHLDGVSYLYVRPGSGAAEATRGSRFSLVRAGATQDELLAKARRDPALMREELGRISPGRLVELADYRDYGAAAAVAGDVPLAQRFLEAGRAAYPGDALLRLNLGTVLLSAGRRDEARRELSSAAALGKGTLVGETARRRLEQALGP